MMMKNVVSWNDLALQSYSSLIWDLTHELLWLKFSLERKWCESFESSDFSFIHFQINNFVSSALIGESNATISTLTYSPKPEDHGRLLACQAFVEGIPGSIVEDSRRLHILCEFPFSALDVRVVNFHKIYYYLKTNSRQLLT